MTFMKSNYTLLPGDEKRKKEKIKEDLKIKKDVKNLNASIKQLQEDRLKNVKSPRSQNEILIGIQFLIFDYLGFIEKLPLHKSGKKLSNINKAYLLSQLFKVDSENIRQRLTFKYHKDTKNVKMKNLKYIIELFEKLGLEEVANKVKIDLSRIEKGMSK